MLRLILLFLVTLFNLALWYWTTTPYYAVSEIRDSIKEHDLDRFERYVDIDSVASKMIDGLLNPSVRQSLGNGVLGRMVGSGVVSLMKPQLIELIKNEVASFIERNDLKRNELDSSFLPELKRKSALELASYNYQMPGRIPSRGLNFFKDIHLHMGFTRRTFRGVSYMRVIGPDCLIGLLLYNDRFQRMLLLELKLTRQEGQWKLVEVSNFPNFLCTLIALERARSESVEQARALRHMRQQMIEPPPQQTQENQFDPNRPPD